jgi:EmrB/QacA subfamily drug resistance transporter
MNHTADTTKRVAAVIAALSSFLAPFMDFSVTVALPSIGREFSMDAVLLGWVATAYSLAAAMFLIPFGKAGDIYGRKKIFTYGMAVYTFASLLCALSTSGDLLIAFRVLQGIGSTMIFGTGVAILTSVFPAEERGRALGLNVAATYSGLSLGPVLGGLLTEHFGWRSVFIANVPIGLIVIALVLWKLRPEWAEAKGETLDYVGSAVYGLSLVAMMYGFSQLPAPLGIGLTLAGILGLALFVGWEMRAESPILNVNLFKNNAAFTFSNLAALINYSATTAVGFLLSLYLQYIKGMTPRDAGLILVAQPVVMAILSPLAGRLSDKIESRTIASAGMGLTAVGLVLLIFLSEQTTLGFVIFSLILLGSGFGLFSSPNVNAVMSSVERRFYGVASAVLGTMRLVGQTLSMGFITLVFALYIGKVEITPETYPLFLSSVKTVFVISAVLCLGGIFASLARGKSKLLTRQPTGKT